MTQRGSREEGGRLDRRRPRCSSVHWRDRWGGEEGERAGQRFWGGGQAAQRVVAFEKAVWRSLLQRQHCLWVTFLGRCHMVEHLGVGEGKVDVEVWGVATLHMRSHILLVLPLALALLHWRGFTFPLNSLVLGASTKVHTGIRHRLQLEAGVRISSRARAQKFLLWTHLLTFHLLRFFLTLGHRLSERVLSAQRRSAVAGEPGQRQRGGMGR